MVAKKALLFAVLLISSVLSADVNMTGVGDWDGQLFVNGALASDGTSICVYVNGAASENDRTTLGAELSGYYLLHAAASSGDNVTFKVFCEYAVNESAQNWSASPPRHHLNLTINHTTAPVLTRIAPASTGVATGTVTLTLATDESANCRYSTSSGVAYANMTSATTSLGTTHSWSVSAPTAGTTYTYYAKCIDQFGYASSDLDMSFTTAGTAPTPTPSGGGNSGGGGGGGGGSGSSTQPPAEYQVDLGNGKTCTVSIKRQLSSGDALSVLTTTLTNIGGSECTMADFVFADTIPDNFAAINEITFTPAYSSREGWTVYFNFPTFVGGESKTLAYSVGRWVPPSRVKNFTNYEMSAKKQAAAPPPVVTPPPDGTKPVIVPTVPPTKPIVTPPAQGGPGPAPQQDSLFGLVPLLIGAAILLGAGALAFYLFFKKKKGL